MNSIGDIGEKAFLRSLLPKLSISQNFVNGFGHDASIIDLGLEKNIVFKVDRASYPIAAINGWSDYHVWGFLAVTANISDILAVGGNPSAFMVSMCLPRSWKTKRAEDIVLGCEKACRHYGISFLGGDTKEGKEAQVVGAAIGTIDRGNHFPRLAAEPGNNLVIAGELGGFLGAYLLYKDDSTLPEEKLEMLNYMETPEARNLEAAFVAKNRLAKSATDLSDGLYDAISIFCGNSVGIKIYEANIPFHKFAKTYSHKNKTSLINLAFGVGDWALAYVMTDNQLEEAIHKIAKNTNLKLTCIGKFTSNLDRILISTNGTKKNIPVLVNEHFRKRMEDQNNYVDQIINMVV